ncbi:MAG: acyl-CoA dehydrogenase family protein [Caldiserica bacterium]|nr:acyl-CoA dehydrogenase family protein [Caldisericota bacterium]
MDLDKEVLSGAVEFIEKYIQPREKEIEVEGLFVKDIFKELGYHGLIAIPFPKEYGGLGLSFRLFVDVSRLIAKHSGTISGVIGAHLLSAFSILIGGTEEQKQKYLTKLIKGELIGSLALTEPNAGSDPSSIETEAKKDGDYYILNGTKAFTTNAGLSDIYVIMAKTDRERGARGMSAFIVESTDENFKIGRQESKMALPGLPNASLFLNDVKLYRDRLVGKEGTGFAIAMKTLDIGRVTTGVGALGLSERALEEAVKYSKKRIQFGKPISSFEMIQSYIADMATEIEASKLLVMNAAEKKDQNDPKFSLYASMAKYYASKVAVDVSRLAVQMFGGYGWIEDYIVARLYKEAKMYEIIEGTSEIQKLVISNYILKEVE